MFFVPSRHFLVVFSITKSVGPTYRPIAQPKAAGYYCSKLVISIFVGEEEAVGGL